MSKKPHREFEHAMIRAPGPRLMRDVHLESVQNRVEGGRGRSVNASLNLTSFIDFLVVVVVFLLMSFSATGGCPEDKHTKLPRAEHTVDMVEAPIIAISGTSILVDGVVSGATRPIEDSGRLMRVDELHAALTHKRELWKQLSPGGEFPGTCVMAIDQRVPALVVKSVFQTAALAGYPNVSFLVGPIPKTR